MQASRLLFHLCRFIDTLRYGQQLLKGKSTVHLGSIDLDEEDASGT